MKLQCIQVYIALGFRMHTLNHGVISTSNGLLSKQPKTPGIWPAVALAALKKSNQHDDGYCRPAGAR